MAFGTPANNPLLEIVRPINPDILQLGKVLEVQRAMLVVVEAQRSIDLDVDWSLLDTAEGTTHEAIVPQVILGDQEIAAHSVTEQQLTLLAHVGGEALRLIGSHVLILGTPFVALRCEAPGGK